jgi:hypothetical protein
VAFVVACERGKEFKALFQMMGDAGSRGSPWRGLSEAKEYVFEPERMDVGDGMEMFGPQFEESVERLRELVEIAGPY